MTTGNSRSRRGAGEGAVYRQADGLWAAAVELGRDSEGRRQRKVIRGRTKATVVAKLEQARADVAKGLPTLDERRTTENYLRWWVKEVLPGTIKDSTVEDYSWVLEHYVIPHVGRVPLAKLAPEQVHQMLRNLEQEGKSARTRQYARAVLRRALGHAERWGMVTRNVAALVEGPRAVKTRLDDTLTAAEAQRLLAVASEDRLCALAVIVLRLGLRKGEVLALRWENVDLDAGELQVQGTLKRKVGEGLVLDTPKTKAGERTLPLLADCREALVSRRRRQAAEKLEAGPAWAEGGFVFTTPLGPPIDPRNVNRWWDSLCERAGIGHRRFHASRHTAATLLLDAGVPLEVVSAILGHASLAITADVYAKVTQDAKRRAVTAVDRLLG